MDEPDTPVTYEYVVLSDGDTYDGVDTSFVYVITGEGDDVLSDSGGFKHLDDKFIVEKISIAELLDCYFSNNRDWNKP